MSITAEKINATMQEVKRFVTIAREADHAIKNVPGTNPKETGALRRASMDLTRSLADLRRS